MPSKLMGIRQYARHRGVRLSTIQAAITAGRIRAPGGKIDWKAADRAWADNTDPSKQNRKPKRQSAPAPESDGTRPGAFMNARTVRETYAAKLTHLKYQTQSGEVIAVAKVKDEWFRIARTIRDALTNAPDRLASIGAAALGVPDKDFKLNALWRDEIRSILEEMSNAAKRYGFEDSENDTAESER